MYEKEINEFMFDALKPFIFPSKDAIKFAIKLSIAAGLALFIAFCLDLNQPQWAAATAVIVAQPHSGMVVSKGLARLVGTLMGTVISLVVTALFSQTPWLFILALSLGLMICTAASTVIRSAWSYSFVLAGYTTAIIVLPDVFKPLSIFDYAIARCTEICLGIICSSAVFAILWPVKVFHGLIVEASNIWQAGLTSACMTLKGENVNEDLLNSLAKIVAIDAQREHALFEGGDGRNRAKAIQNMCHDILALLRAARGVSRQMRFLTKEDCEQLQPLVNECIEILAAPTYKSLNVLAKKLQEKDHSDRPLPQQDIIARLEMLVQCAIFAGLDLASVRAGKLKRKAKASYLSIHRDYSLGLFFGLRSALAFLILSVFWMMFGWPINEASGSLMMVAVICSMFANKENAAQISMGFLRGVCYSVVISFIVSQLILPSWSGFPLLWLAIGVPLFIGSLGMVKPAIAGTCTVFSINLLMLCRPTNHGFQSTEMFINQSLAMPLGVIAALLAFHLVKINTPYWQGKYMLGAMLKDLRKLTQGSIKGAETWFGGRMADRLVLLARHRSIMAQNAEKRWYDALHVMDLGDEILNLRANLAKKIKIRTNLNNYLDELAKVFERGPDKVNVALLNKASEQLKVVIREKELDTQGVLAISAIMQIQQVWHGWYQEQKNKQEEEYGIA